MTILRHVFLANSIAEGGLAALLLLAPQKAVAQLLVTPAIIEPYVENVARLYGASLASVVVTSLLQVGLPDILPGKRNVALGMLVYHGLVAIGAFHFRSQETVARASTAWGATILHTAFSLAFYAYWNVTGQQVKQFAKQQKKAK
ncbi:hypothetical protein K450DRAFT_283843 [Umbelopsis ramanniana AG]|uniref:Uncharacterized protein n=1 Tax=Umbelopsis ramanniana AG TaxID=1314678 RepID=A0AAD5HAQ6_UMBRA|nr:uncharacterized protein K450DRAFT_283843 [Umbelopsis ramanniana AG]KAI8575999.1 hypothetical protein K450DRAFT_283843 [Umbelopsis ramanniana AG]